MNSQAKTTEPSKLEKVSDFTDEKGSKLGEGLENLNESAADLKMQAESGYEQTVSPAIDQAQIKLAGASRYLQESSPEDYLRDLEGYAKKHPRVTAAVCALIGWKLGRLLKF